MNNPDKRAEMTKELRSARNHLIIVGILMFLADVVLIQYLQREYFGADVRKILFCIDVLILGLFFALAYYVPRKPRLCLIAGLVLFWIIQVAGAYGDPKALFTKGIIVKVLFTMALWKGLQSASRAQSLKRDLERVFE